jgi:tetrahydromethanopterin S-methyltransferase subunit G
MSDYMHNDDVADLMYAKDAEINDLRKRVSKLLQHLDYVITELNRVETEYARGL